MLMLSILNFKMPQDTIMPMQVARGGMIFIINIPQK